MVYASRGQCPGVPAFSCPVISPYVQTPPASPADKQRSSVQWPHKNNHGQALASGSAPYPTDNSSKSARMHYGCKKTARGAIRDSPEKICDRRRYRRRTEYRIPYPKCGTPYLFHSNREKIPPDKNRPVEALPAARPRQHR